MNRAQPNRDPFAAIAGVALEQATRMARFAADAAIVKPMLDAFEACLAHDERVSPRGRALLEDFRMALLPVAALTGDRPGMVCRYELSELVCFLHMAAIWRDRASVTFTRRLAAEEQLVGLVRMIRATWGLA